MKHKFSYVPQHQVQDIVQTGYLGLVKAANAFKPSKGFAFSTYAIRAIENEMRSELYKMTSTLNISRPRLAKYASISRQIDDLDTLSDADIELIQSSGMNVADFKQIRNAINAKSVDEVLHFQDGSEKDLHYGDTISDINAQADGIVELKQVLMKLYRESRNKYEKTILSNWIQAADTQLFELPCEDEIAEELGTTQSYINRIKRKLRIRLNKELGGNYC